MAEKPKSASDAVRAFLALGLTDTKRIIDESKSKWGIEVTKATIYNVKASEKRKGQTEQQVMEKLDSAPVVPAPVPEPSEAITPVDIGIFIRFVVTCGGYTRAKAVWDYCSKTRLPEVCADWPEKRIH